MLYIVSVKPECQKDENFVSAVVWAQTPAQAEDKIRLNCVISNPVTDLIMTPAKGNIVNANYKKEPKQ